MQWVLARLHEDSSRSGLGQLGLLCLLIGLGLDDHLFAFTNETGGWFSVAGVALTVLSQGQRVVTKEPAPAPTAEETMERLAKVAASHPNAEALTTLLRAFLPR